MYTAKLGRGLIAGAIAAVLFTGAISFALAQEAPAEPTSTDQTTEISTPSDTLTTETTSPDTAETTSADTTEAAPSADTEEPAASTETETPAETSSTDSSTEVTETAEAAATEEPSAPASSPVITTNKSDYAPGETVKIMGEFFAAMQNIVFMLVGTAEDGSQAWSDSWTTQADDAGSFTSYRDLPDFYVPLYLLAANSQTGEVLAETNFTDAALTDAVINSVGTPCGTNSASLPTGSSVCAQTTATVSGVGSPPSVTLLVQWLNPSNVVTFTDTHANPINGQIFSDSQTLSTVGTWTVRTCKNATCAGSNLLRSQTISITAAVVKTNPTVSVTNSPQTYTGSPIAATVNGSVAGTVSDVKYDGSATVPTNAGTYAVTADFAPTDTTNYNNLDDASAGSFTISQAVSVTDVTCPAGPYTYTGGAQTPCSVTVTGANLNLTPAPNYSDNTNAGLATASYTYGGDANHTGSSDSANFTIDQASLTAEITASDKPYDGTTSATASCALTGVFGDDVVTCNATNSEFSDENAATGITVTADIVLVGADKDNYTVNATDTDEANITPIDADCSITGYDVVYDGNPHTASGQCLDINDVPLTGLDLSGTTHTNAGSYPTDPWTFTSPSTNYNSGSGTVADNIDKADAICSVTGYTVTYDGNAHTATGSCLGVLGETLSGLDLSGTTHTGAFGSPFSDSWIFTDVTGNYNDASDTVVDTINKADQTITFADLVDKIFGSPDFALAASASSGLGVSFSSDTTNTCTVSGSTVHLIGLANTTCTIRASQAGDNNYNAAPEVTQSFQILPYGVPKTLPPISLTKKDFQKSSTIPVKFNIKSTVDGSLVTWATAKLDIATSQAGPWTPAVSSGGSNTNNFFRSGDQYVFNLSTKMQIFLKGNSYTLRITLDDGEVIYQVINIK